MSEAFIALVVPGFVLVLTFIIGWQVFTDVSK
jgi:hypothetical protein